jgi:hypothetical protein
MEIAEEYGFNKDYSAIKKVLDLHNIETRTRSENKKLKDEKYSEVIGYNGRKYTCNGNYFDNWSNEMAYILGFISADGCVKGSNLVISLQRQDKQLLEDIGRCLKYTGFVKDSVAKITKKQKSYDISTLNIISKTLTDRLKELNVIENKSLVITMPNIPKEFIIDYIRGYFDGNGSVGVQYPKSKRTETKTAQIRVRICGGSEVFITQIRDVLHEFGLRNVSVRKKKGKQVYDICYSTKDSFKIYELFYKNTNIITLQRKKEKFDEIIKLRKKDIELTNGHIKVK